MRRYTVEFRCADGRVLAASVSGQLDESHDDIIANAHRSLMERGLPPFDLNAAEVRVINGQD